MFFGGRGILSHTQFWIPSMLFSSTQQILLFALDTGDWWIVSDLMGLAIYVVIEMSFFFQYSLSHSR